MSPSRDSWSSSLDIQQPGSAASLRGTHTSDLADFLRSTGPDAPPSPPAQPTPQPDYPPLSTSSNPAQQPSAKSGFTLRKYLRKASGGGNSSTGLGKKDGALPSSASTTSLNKRRFTAESFGSSGSAAVTAAVNKALHNVPPPTNVQPKVFANGHTIYMINTPPQFPSPNPSSSSSADNGNFPTQNHHGYTSPASAYAATISTARISTTPGLANKPQPPPLRTAVSFHGTSPSASSTAVHQQQGSLRPKTASGESTPTPSTATSTKSPHAYIPPVPRIPSPVKHQVHDALLVVPRAPHPHHREVVATVRRALSPIGSSEDAHGGSAEGGDAPEDYDIQFDSAEEGENLKRTREELSVAPAEVDGSDLDPTLLAISRMRAARNNNAARTGVEGVAEETEEDEEQVEITMKDFRTQTPRLGSTSSTLLSQRSRGSLSSGHRRSESHSTLSGRAGSIQSLGSYTAGAGGRTTPSSIRRSGSMNFRSTGSTQQQHPAPPVTTTSPERARKTPSPTAPRQLPPPTTALPPLPSPSQEIDPQWVSRDIAASPRMVVTAASPLLASNFSAFSTVHPNLVGRDRSGSDTVSFVSAKSLVETPGGPYRRDRSMSVGVAGGVPSGQRSSSGNMVYNHHAAVGDGLGSPPLNPPPSGPPPPTPSTIMSRTPIRAVKASESPRSSIRRAAKVRPTILPTDQAPTSPAATARGSDAPSDTAPIKTPTRRGSAPDMSRSSIQFILDPKTAPPVPAIPGGRDTFGGYVFPAATESSGSEMEKDESEEDDDEDEGERTTKLPDSPSHSSVYLKEQLENVLKMNDAYLELATADKEARRSSKPAPMSVPPSVPAPISVPATVEEKTPVLGSPAEFTSMRANKADSTRTVSVTSTRSAASSVSVGRINVAYVSSASGPPRLPLPPSPVTVPANIGSVSPTHASPLAPSTSPASAIQPATTPQAQITTLTYALHTQRNRYEGLSAHLCQQQALWDDQRAAYETKLSEIEREKVDLVAEREQFAKRLQELEKELAERDHRISQLEAEKFAWERERKGLRWLVTSGRMGASAGSRPMSRAGSSSKEAAHMKPTDSELTAISVEDSVEEPLTTTEPKTALSEQDNVTDQTVRIDVTEVTPTPRRSHNSSSTAPSRPLSVISVTSQVSVTSSRTSLDDGLLHPRITAPGSSNKMKRHSMYEAATIATPSSASRRPLSAALEDMLLKLRSLGEEDRDSSHDESSSKRSNPKKTSVGMTSSKSTPFLSATPKAPEESSATPPAV
ncbi:hypothetical protein FRC05_004554 [Tulasnella sp. 425]|nr:hypothetical protein FRC05_004554 [Tulasnella sp. 425]